MSWGHVLSPSDTGERSSVMAGGRRRDQSPSRACIHWSSRCSMYSASLRQASPWPSVHGAGFPGLGGDTNAVVWHTASGTVRAADVEPVV